MPVIVSNHTHTHTHTYIITEDSGPENGSLNYPTCSHLSSKKKGKKCMKNERHFFEKRFHARHVEVHFFNVEVRHEVFILFFCLEVFTKNNKL